MTLPTAQRLPIEQNPGLAEQGDPRYVGDPERLATTSRADVEFYSHGTRCAAWLYRPAAAEPPPLVIMAHGLGAIRQIRLDAYAQRFREAGLAVLVFDYRYIGDSDGEPRQLVSLRAQRQDWHAALTYARTIQGVDSSRIAIWGTSLAGGHVLKVAAAEQGLRAVVAQCPFTSGPASVRALGLRSAIVAGIFGVADVTATLLGRGPVLVPLVGMRRSPALMKAPDVVASVLAMLPPGSEFSRQLSRLYRRFAQRQIALPDGLSLGEKPEPIASSRLVGTVYTPDGGAMPNGLAGRIALTIGLDRPATSMRRIHCPTLICAAERDTVAPANPTKRAAQRAGLELHSYDAGHFDIYIGDAFEQVISDQIAFLGQHLGTTNRT
jgi:uncharacterized protein